MPETAEKYIININRQIETGVINLTEYEKLLDMAAHESISIDEAPPFSGTNIKGLYLDHHIAINKDMRTDAERSCVLAEELGHHYTTTGNILDQSITENRKQEHRARVWAYRRAFGLVDLISAYKYGCRNRYELAEYLNVTESFLIDAINYYKTQYGLYSKVDNYVIYFEPLGVLELNME